MDEEIMDFQWLEHVTWDSIKDLRGTTYVQPPTFTTTQPLRPQNQPGKRWCLAAGSSWDDLQSMPLRATVSTTWTLGWSLFGLKIGLLSGPWYVLNVMLLRCRTRRAGQKSSKCSHVFAKLLHWRVLVKKEEPWQLPETRPQFQSPNKLFKRSRAFILRIQSHKRQRQLQFQLCSKMKLLSMSLLRSEKCLDSVKQDLSACVPNTGMTSALWQKTVTCLCK